MITLEALRAGSRRLADQSAWNEVRELLLPHADAIATHPECAQILGEALLRVGRAREARDWFGGALPRLHGTDDRRSLRIATVQLGAAHLELGELSPARRAFEAALELARYDHDDVLVARAMNNLGIVANIEGRWDEALALYALAMTVYQRNGDRRGLAECSHNMAITHRDRGELTAADELERRSAEHAREADQARLVALARMGRAEIALRRRDFTLVEATARRLATDFTRLGDPIRSADALRLTGVACTGLGRFGEAATLLDRALTESEALGAVLNVAETLRARGELLVAMGALDAARADYRAAIEAYRRMGAAREIANVEDQIAELA